MVKALQIFTFRTCM